LILLIYQGCFGGAASLLIPCLVNDEITSTVNIFEKYPISLSWLQALGAKDTLVSPTWLIPVDDTNASAFYRGMRMITASPNHCPAITSTVSDVLQWYSFNGRSIFIYDEQRVPFWLFYKPNGILYTAT